MKLTKIFSYRTFLTCIILLATLLTLGGCASRQVVINSDDYVEIDNPFIGESPDASPKIWVPKSSVQKGLFRDKAVDATAVVDARTPPTTGARIRLQVVEAGEQSVTPILKGLLTQGNIARIVPRSTPTEAVTAEEQLAYLTASSRQSPGGPVLFITKPEGVKPEARIKGDLYDSRGPILIRSFWVAVPKPLQGQSTTDALKSALKGIADSTLVSLQWFPWYGQVVKVSDERIYVDAGAESGLTAGQKLRVYREGEVVPGIGFTPGDRITSFTITELINQDGSCGVSPEVAAVKAGDYVELEK
ncbi:MAG: hypothetical protein ACOYL3_04570 [Desulfuromonadaceae bacterium]